MTDDEFLELHAGMYTSMLRFASRRLGSHQAEDVVADAFVVVWDKRATCTGDEDGRAAWAFGILKKKILQAQDRRTRHPHDHRFAADHPQAESVTVGSDEAATSRVHAAWLYAQLSPGERDLIDVSTLPGITTATAADLIGVTPGAYATRVSRLRRKITDLVRADQEGAAS